ncbi:hypothetical protein [Streptomyces capitiformicae]|uniref:Uncharacterized protein n=1 Tax=Streptomyces capitiformicae TaxID=2014920 RepID=A0A919L9J1_9ACTN|nr:hypothetical protein [Streptomyces capitiformicae]GHH88299.1 hypothetical protein GCM10017771_32940 [Streptomyces capitiformicae]
MPVTTDGETVAYILRSDDGYAVQARDGATGKVRWTGARYQVPTPITDEPNLGYYEDELEIPQVTVVRQGGRTYVAAWSHGEQAGDALAKSQEVVQVDLYAMDGSGSSVAPLRRVSVPVSTVSAFTVKVYDSGGDAGLVVSWHEPSRHLGATVDVTTGKVTEYDDPSKLVPQCPSACVYGDVVAATPKGAVGTNNLGGFGVKGSWASQDIAPEAADPGKTSVGGYVSGTFAGVDSGMFLATWKSADGSDTRLWSAHDLHSGRLLASMACGEEGTDNVTAAVTSPNGRYLALDSVVFDVKAGKGLCLVGDGTRRTINIRALTDDGTMYGETDADNGGKSAIELNVNTNSPKALSEGTQLPAAVLKEGAVFTLRENGAGLRISVRQER